jgi:hypothetical protein
VPALVLEYALLVLPIPRQLQSAPALVWLAGALCVALALAYARGRDRIALPGRRAADLALFQLAALSLFYGLFFGAGHFMERYLFPASAFLAVAWGAAVVSACGYARARAGELAAALPIAVVCALVAAGGARLYALGAEHMHFQAVRWVEDNLGEDTWVGAPQSGTLGFFHDRTLNLDGKVNPAAYEARTRAGGIERYVLDLRIPYIVDWATVVDLMNQPAMAASYTVLVHDPRANLGVLRWGGSAAAGASGAGTGAP